MERTQRLTARVAAMTVAVLVAAGCGSAPSPTEETAAASANPTALETPAPSATPTLEPIPTPTPVPTGPTLLWTAVYSSDGPAKDAPKLKGGISAAVAFGDGFVLAGSEDKTRRTVIYWYSPDGSSWQAIDNAPGFADGVIGFLVPLSDGLLAVGTAQKLDSQCADGALGCNPVSPIRLWTSADGRDWHALPGTATAPFGRAQLDLIVPGPSGLVAFGKLVPPTGTDIKAMIWTSADGRAWSPAPQFSTAFPTDTIFDLAAGPGGYVAVGSPRRAWYSTDGKTWKLASGPAGQGPSIVLECAGGFLGVENPSSQAAFWTSTDGVSWTVQPRVVDRPDDPAYVGTGLFSDGDRILAFGADAHQTRGAWISSDGRNWQSVVLGGPLPPLDTANADSVVGAFGPKGLLVTTATDSAPGVTSWTIWLGTLSR